MEFLWRIVARIVSHPPIARWIIRRAQRSPYFHLEGYMRRWWLFNPYKGSSQAEADTTADSARHGRRWRWLPSIRVHHILREDRAEHAHDHPWDARTIILKGGYLEARHFESAYRLPEHNVWTSGDTTPIRHGQFHHIEQVSWDGVWTLFFTWDYRGTWGFLVDGKKIPWREYLRLHPERKGQTDG